MNPQAFELWYENFSGTLRLNPRWDSYERLALELFRNKHRPLTVIEFGFTPKVCEWAKDQCFTMQMDWMAEKEYANCLVVYDDVAFLEKARKDFPKVRTFCPTVDDVTWCELVLMGKPIIETQKADLIFAHESIAGVYDWSLLKSGALVVMDFESATQIELKGFRRIHHGAFDIWKKTEIAQTK